MAPDHDPTGTRDGAMVQLLAAVAGAVMALLLLRARTHSTADGVGFLRAVVDLPAVLADDLGRARSSARGALRDGHAAAEARRREVDRMLAGIPSEDRDDREQ